MAGEKENPPQGGLDGLVDIVPNQVGGIPVHAANLAADSGFDIVNFGFGIANSVVQVIQRIEQVVVLTAIHKFNHSISDGFKACLVRIELFNRLLHLLLAVHLSFPLSSRSFASMY